MFDNILLRAVTFMLFVTQCGFMLLLSEYNPYMKDEVTTELPVPTFYSEDDIVARNNEIRIVEEPVIQVVENVHYINQKEYECLVKNIYFEARNQSNAGKQAIAVVTLERVKKKGYPPTICQVVTEERKRGVCQFSWRCDGKSDIPYLESKDELAAWKRAEKVAEDALLGRVDPIIKGATMFHADYVKPDWDYSKLKFLAKIGDHLFYMET